LISNPKGRTHHQEDSPFFYLRINIFNLSHLFRIIEFIEARGGECTDWIGGSCNWDSGPSPDTDLDSDPRTSLFQFFDFEGKNRISGFYRKDKGRFSPFCYNPFFNHLLDVVLRFAADCVFLYVLFYWFTLIYKFVVGHRVGQFFNGAVTR
jgi:hypothetical protein